VRIIEIEEKNINSFRLLLAEHMYMHTHIRERADEERKGLVGAAAEYFLLASLTCSLADGLIKISLPAGYFF